MTLARFGVSFRQSFLSLDHPRPFLFVFPPTFPLALDSDRVFMILFVLLLFSSTLHQSLFLFVQMRNARSAPYLFGCVPEGERADESLDSCVVYVW